MKRLTVAAILCAVPFGAAASSVFAAATNPNVVTVAMPGELGHTYKSGPGQKLAQTYCLTCHSSAYVEMQPAMDAEHWLVTVKKMSKAYGAHIPEADGVAIADYLGRAYGPPAKPQ